MKIITLKDTIRGFAYGSREKSTKRGFQLECGIVPTADAASSYVSSFVY
jgi:hypothetical protein